MREPVRRTGGPEIPHAIHRVWLGGAAMPEAHARFGQSFAELHPGWEQRLWTDADLPSLDIGQAERERARSASELSNLVRYEVLYRIGGVYVDTDVLCLRPFDELIAGLDAFAGLELPGRVGTAVLGAVPGHPLFERAARLTRQTLGVGPHSADANGPYFLSLLAEQEQGLAIFGADRFYPYRWDEPERAGETFGDAHAVHHWSMSWWEGESA
jgi:mannosyltransferase OCH1-like enzyme